MPKESFTTGLQQHSSHLVAASDTAAVLGSGDLQVLGTPRLLAWMEASTCALLEPLLDPAETSVGTRMAMDHQKASVVGSEVSIEATLSYVDGRLVRFDVVALSAAQPIGTAEITRVIVDRERFLARIS